MKNNYFIYKIKMTFLLPIAAPLIAGSASAGIAGYFN